MPEVIFSIGELSLGSYLSRWILEPDPCLLWVDSHSLLIQSTPKIPHKSYNLTHKVERWIFDLWLRILDPKYSYMINICGSIMIKISSNKCFLIILMGRIFGFLNFLSFLNLLGSKDLRFIFSIKGLYLKYVYLCEYASIYFLPYGRQGKIK